SLTPTGLLNANVTSLRVTFSENILASTFTAADVAVTGPGGPLDPATFSVTQLDGRTFQVNLPTLSAEGAYPVRVAPDIPDPSNNPMTAAAQTWFPIDKTGPHVPAASPTGTVGGVVSAVDVTFSEPLNLGSFSPADVVLTGPNGTIAVGSPDRKSTRLNSSH